LLPVQSTHIMRMKSLSSLKKNRRYLIFKVHAEQKLDYFNVRDAIWNSLTGWLGEKELALADVWIMKNLWSPHSMTGFIRCNHTAVDAVKAGLALIHQIGDQQVVFQTLRVTGTIASAKKKLSKSH